MKWQQCFIMFCCVIFALTCCSCRMPVFIPDDENVLALSKSAVSDISDITIDIQGTIVYGADKTGVGLNYSNCVTGDVNGVLSGKRSVSQYDLRTDDSEVWMFSDDLPEGVVKSKDALHWDEQWYLDSDKDAYYEKQTDTEWIGYSNGKSIVDVSWWLSQLDSSTFKYNGKTTDSNDNEVYLLEAVYSEDDVVTLIRHLGLRLNVSALKSDMRVSLYVDRWSGVPTELQISVLDTGSPIVVSNDDVLYDVSAFKFQMLFDMKSDDVSIPDDVLALDLQQPNNSLLVVGSETMDEKTGLSLNDTFVNVIANDVFDVVDYDFDKNQINVSSSKALDGQPTMSISLVDNMDAYTNALLDRNVIFDFYNKQGLIELYVSKKLKQFSVADCESYIYSTQYTEPEYGYVSIDYFVYIALSDNSFAKVIISSMTDRGVNTVLTRAYVDSMLSQISIKKVGDNV